MFFVVINQLTIPSPTAVRSVPRAYHPTSTTRHDTMALTSSSADDTSAIDAALDLMRHLPPQNLEANLSGVVALAPAVTEEVLSRVDQPLRVSNDPTAGRAYVLCDYNRDLDSYRSPWSNRYFPALPDGGDLPSIRLRRLEARANDVFDMYREQYYQGGVSSVYLWELDDDADVADADAALGAECDLGSFAGVFLVHKDVPRAGKGGEGKEKNEELLEKGHWDATHVVEVTRGQPGAGVHYKLTSTVALYFSTPVSTVGSLFSMAGSVTRQVEQMGAGGDDHEHIVTVGRMIEAMEGKLRSSLDELYFKKTREVVEHLRASDGVMKLVTRQSMMAGLMNEMVAKKRVAATAGGAEEGNGEK